MKPTERLIGLTFMVFLAVLWLGFLLHRDARFAGSLLGGILAILGSFLLFVPLLYLVIKRVPLLKRLVTKKISFPTLLTIHIYAGFIGAILVLLHTGHKFNGTLASSLTALLLIVVLSGYIGRYLLSRVSKDLTEKKQLLSALESQYGAKVIELHSRPEEKNLLAQYTGFFSRLRASTFFSRGMASLSPASDVLSLAESIADVEYAISTHALFQRLFSIWLKLHITLSVLFYLLLVLHIGGAYYFGLRWFE
ncbi:MAG: hypothetical protein K2X47_09905 [Bdellovibrionales bacterium]|nr:hypothetical protein [Bdellovibrionales bacterium]